MCSSTEAPEPSDSRATADSPASVQTKVVFPGLSESTGTAGPISKSCSRKRKVGVLQPAYHPLASHLVLPACIKMLENRGLPWLIDWSNLAYSSRVARTDPEYQRTL